jgi:hypothetical protein
MDYIDFLIWQEMAWDMNQDTGSNEPTEENNV